MIANPNAPTGLTLSRAEIEAVLRANLDHVVAVDEAYVDFGGESVVPLISEYDNLLVVQTFSKSRQLAGARVGFALGQEALIRDLETIKYATNPYNVNRLSMAAAVEAMRDRAYFEARCREIMETRAWTAAALTELGFRVTDSRANFLFAASDRIEGGELYRQLKERGILIRHFTAPRISNYNRITVGTPEEMQALVDAIRLILE